MKISPHNISRRDFHKSALAGVAAIFLTPFHNVTGREGLPNASATLTPSSTPDPTLAKLPRFKLLSPLQGSQLKAIGRVSFTWEAFPGAASYRLEIISPTGKKVTFIVKSTRHDRYMESLPWGGNFIWQVVALDAGLSGMEKPIGFAGPFPFQKPALPEPIWQNGREKRDQDHGTGGSSLGGGGPGSGIPEPPHPIGPPVSSG